MSRDNPLSTDPDQTGLSSVLHRNIAALSERRAREAKAATLEERIAGQVTRFTGSMAFVYLHLAALAVWVGWNAGLIASLKPFDPSFVILATTASVEAIFLSTFVLISQNRASAAADRRADLDLQINLLAEHEITRLLELTSAIAAKVGAQEARKPELSELQRDVAPEAVLDRLEGEAEDD